MNARFDVPAVPVLIPLAAVLMVISWLVLRRRGVFTGPRLVTAWAAVAYLMGVLAFTLLPLQVALGAYANQTPWYNKGSYLPLLTIDVTTFVLNIVMTAPLGVLLPLLGRIRDVRQLAVRALCFSAAIESVQLLTNLVVSSGRTADVNDLLANTLGAVLGYLAWRRLTRVVAIREMAARLTIPARATEDNSPRSTAQRQNHDA